MADESVREEAASQQVVEASKRARGDRLAADIALLRDPATGKDLSLEEVRLSYWLSNPHSRVQPTQFPPTTTPLVLTTPFPYQPPNTTPPSVTQSTVPPPRIESAILTASQPVQAEKVATVWPTSGGDHSTSEPREERAADCCADTVALETITEVTEEVPAASATPAYPQRTPATIHHSPLVHHLPSALKHGAPAQTVVNGDCPQGISPVFERDGFPVGVEAAGGYSPIAVAADPQEEMGPGTGDVTLCTAGAFAELNDMFSSVLPHSRGARSPASAPSHELQSLSCEPDNTGIPQESVPESPESNAGVRSGGVNDENAGLGGAHAPVTGRHHFRRPLLLTELQPATPAAQPELTVPNTPPVLAVEETDIQNRGQQLLPAPDSPYCSPGVAQPLGKLYRESPVAAAAGDVTMCTRDAFAELNDMFGGCLPHEASRQLPVEPTVTIATQEAFAAFNDMFGGGLPREEAARRTNRPAMPQPPRSRQGTAHKCMHRDLPHPEDIHFPGSRQSLHF